MQRLTLIARLRGELVNHIHHLQNAPSVNGHLNLPTGGHEKCPVVANKNCPVAATDLPMMGMATTGLFDGG
jgi:hypothetical protein